MRAHLRFDLYMCGHQDSANISQVQLFAVQNPCACKHPLCAEIHMGTGTLSEGHVPMPGLRLQTLLCLVLFWF